MNPNATSNIAALAYKMRQAQRKYYTCPKDNKELKQSLFRLAKALEHRLDGMLNDWLNKDNADNIKLQEWLAR